MTDNPKTFTDYLQQSKVSRRSFLKFCGIMATTLALPASAARVIAQALATAPRLPVIWLEFQDCTGDTESFIRAGARPDALQPNVTDPGIIDLLLDFVSLEYHETLMTPSGNAAEKSLSDVLTKYPGQFLCIVEGSIPLAQGGAYCSMRGRTALSLAQQVCGQAKANMAVGSCSIDGGLAAALPNPTGAVGLRTAVPTVPNLINLPGCPANVVNMAACLVYFITYNTWPPLDSSGKPKFAYGKEIHEYCERNVFYEADKYVLAWGDEGHKLGWCLKKMGCKGPETKHNCYSVKWNDATSWPIGAGHGCIGCAATSFWDKLGPIYKEA
jgi:hydrogenase small subunit